MKLSRQPSLASTQRFENLVFIPANKQQNRVLEQDQDAQNDRILDSQNIQQSDHTPVEIVNQIKQLRKLVQAKNEEQSQNNNLRQGKKSQSKDQKVQRQIKCSQNENATHKIRQSKRDVKQVNDENKENMIFPNGLKISQEAIILRGKKRQSIMNVLKSSSNTKRKLSQDKQKTQVLQNITNLIRNMNNEPQMQKGSNLLSTGGLKGTRKLSQDFNKKSQFEDTQGLAILPSHYRIDESYSNLTQILKSTNQGLPRVSNQQSYRSQSMMSQNSQQAPQVNDLGATQRDFMIKKRKSMIHIPTAQPVSSPQNIESNEFDLTKQKSQQLKSYLDNTQDQIMLSQCDTNATSHVNLSNLNIGISTSQSNFTTQTHNINQQYFQQYMRRSNKNHSKSVLSSKDYTNASISMLLNGNEPHQLDCLTVEEVHLMKVSINLNQNELLRKQENKQHHIPIKKLHSDQNTIEFCTDQSL